MSHRRSTADDRAPVGADLHAIGVRYVVWAIAIAAVFTLASGLAGTTPLYVVRLASYAALFAVALVLRRGEHSVNPILVGFYALWWVMPVIDLATDFDYGYGDRLTMGVALVVVSVATTGLNRDRGWLIPFFSATNGAWTVITALQADVSAAVIGDELVAIVVGYWLLSRMILRLTQEADTGYRQARRAARIDEVLAALSECLLGGSGEEALEEALGVLVSGVSCDGMIVEEIDRSGDGLRRVAASAGHVESDRMKDGVVGDLPTLDARLAEPGAAFVDVGSLDSVEAEQYRPFGAEVAIPVVVDGAVWGRLVALSAESARSAGELWDAEEILMLTRSADTIAAFWEREDANERLRELMRSKDEFIASVSHELRTPLTVVVGLAEELAGPSSARLAPSEIDELHQMVADQSAEMAQIVEDLLVAARADLGTLSVQYVAVDVQSAVQEVIDRLSGTFLRERTVRLAGSAAPAHADPLRFRQIIRNLVTNAARYGGDTIEVELGESGDIVTIAVSDDGEGIPDELAEEIFQPYTSAHHKNGEPGSMGLGLTVARDLSRLMGGDLSLSMEPGRTTFVATFPRYQGEPST